MFGFFIFCVIIIVSICDDVLTVREIEKYYENKKSPIVGVTMRELSPEEIASLSSRPGVKKMAVENFLASMGNDSHGAWENLRADMSSYRWNEDTVQAISDGIVLAGKNS